VCDPLRQTQHSTKWIKSEEAACREVKWHPLTFDGAKFLTKWEAEMNARQNKMND
jgi:hypothetical protein